MIIIFIGPPFSGKDTQTNLLSKELNLPVFSMGELIRKAVKAGDPKAIEGFEEYAMKGKHLPNSLKFYLLEQKMDEAKKGFILDNFPATKEDLEVLLSYLEKHKLKIDKAFNLWISEGEMKKRINERGRQDDDPQIISERRKNQDKDRMPVADYFKEKGILEEINGEGEIEEIHKEIKRRLKI